MKTTSHLCWLSYFWLLPHSLTASPCSPTDCAPGKIVSEIHFHGLESTQPAILTKRVLYKVNSEFSLQEHEISVQNLKNLQIFSNITSEVSLKKDGTLRVDYFFEEAVTFIPFVVPSASAAGFSMTVGFFESNTFGLAHTTVYTLGYDSGDNTINTSLSYTAAELFNSDYTVHLGAKWQNNKTIFKIKNEEPTENTGDDDIYAGGWGSNHLGANAVVSYPLIGTLDLGIGLDITKMKYTDSQDKIDTTITSANTVSELTLPQDNTQISAILTAHLGRIDVDRFLANGFLVSAKAEVPTQSQKGEDRSGVNYSGYLKSFFSFNHDWLHVSRFHFDYTDSQLAQHLSSMQNISMIRGVPENIYWGKGIWSATQELRVPVHSTQSWIYKLALFSDFGQAIDAPDFLTTRNASADAFILSVGGGFRAFFKKITALGIIMDVGYQIKPENNLNFRFHLREMVPF